MGAALCRCDGKLCACCCCPCVTDLYQTNDGYEPIKSIISSKESEINDICEEVWKWIKNDISSEQLMWKICNVLGNKSTTKLSTAISGLGDGGSETIKPVISTAIGISIGILLGKLFDYFSDAIYQQFFPQNSNDKQSLIQRAMKLLNYKKSDIKTTNIGNQQKLKEKCKQKLIILKHFDDQHHDIYGDECVSNSDISTDSDESEILTSRANGSSRFLFNNKDGDDGGEIEMEVGMIIQQYQRCVGIINDDTMSILLQKEDKLFSKKTNDIKKNIDYTESKYVYRY